MQMQNMKIFLQEISNATRENDCFALKSQVTKHTTKHNKCVVVTMKCTINIINVYTILFLQQVCCIVYHEMYNKHN